MANNGGSTSGEPQGPTEIEAALQSLGGELQDLSVTMTLQLGAVLQGLDRLGERLAAIELNLAQTTHRSVKTRDAVPLSTAMHELADGVAFWASKANWPNDFHNADYETWAAQNPRGNFSAEWWPPFRRRLWDWIAIRPNSYADVNQGLANCLPELTDAWHAACEPFLDADITQVTWEQVRAFPRVVQTIKPTKAQPSAVFTSKFCHFLLPRVFPVVDNEAMKNTRTYEGYFRHVQQEWEETPVADQQALIEQLTRLIEAEGGKVFNGFPMVNKLVELRIIGRCYPGMAGGRLPS